MKAEVIEVPDGTLYQCMICHDRVVKVEQQPASIPWRLKAASMSAMMMSGSSTFRELDLVGCGQCHAKLQATGRLASLPELR